ncbi:hypothetical protein RRG08_060982 [Elysia crispata]|uniref:Uncharacterized protein n=1 Tax=Elysia crispata TaxID=231223 RepID=A0AAE1E518_9GAST|nr:hypothetical protein RRG08_060982 [Elysia crispata]
MLSLSRCGHSSLTGHAAGAARESRHTHSPGVEVTSPGRRSPDLYSCLHLKYTYYVSSQIEAIVCSVGSRIDMLTTSGHLGMSVYRGKEDGRLIKTCSTVVQCSPVQPRLWLLTDKLGMPNR